MEGNKSNQVTTILAVIFAAGFLIMSIFAFEYKGQDSYYTADCIKDGCNEGYKCLTGIEDQICVKDSFYAQYWSIFNLYQYDSCRLNINGNPGQSYSDNKDITLGFFAMTLKECDMLRASCMEPERYNTDCSWDESKLTCTCNTKPLPAKTASSNVTINILPSS